MPPVLVQRAQSRIDQVTLEGGIGGMESVRSRGLSRPLP
jgi:hypothetical protein